MKIGLLQYSPEWENPEANVEKINDILAGKNLAELDAIVFPELTLTGFTMNSKKFAEEIDGISHRFFIELAAKNKVNVFGGLIENDSGRIFNTMLHIDDFGLIKARYRKIHPFSYAREERFFSSGKEPVLTEINRAKTGMTICYDLRFPELYRIYALRGAEIIINIANWPVTRIKHWDLLLQANAVFSQSIVIGVNRTGNDPFNEYNGHSRVFLPDGTALNGITEKEGLIVVEFDAETVKDYRQKFPFLKDAKLLQ